jgi:hypothetical protein
MARGDKSDGMQPNKDAPVELSLNPAPTLKAVALAANLSSTDDGEALVIVVVKWLVRIGARCRRGMGAGEEGVCARRNTFSQLRSAPARLQRFFMKRYAVSREVRVRLRVY